MKNLLLIFSLSCILISCETDRLTSFTCNNETCSLIITNNTTKAELEDIADFLQNEKNVAFDFSNSTFNKDGVLEEASIYVDFGDGFEGTANANNFSLKTAEFGFIRTFNPNGKDTFRIGGLK
jgi:hypothetical protein